MKRILTPIALLTMSIAVLTSCERKVCYDCQTERFFIVMPENDTTHIHTANKIHCEQTEETKREIEINGTNYTTYYKDGKLHQEYTITTCK